MPYDNIISRSDVDSAIPVDVAAYVIAAMTQESAALTLFKRAQLSTKNHPATRASLPPREDRDLNAKLFGDSNSASLRRAIARACKAAGVPLFSPHDVTPPADQPARRRLRLVASEDR